jgi:hypothetical protein
LWTAVVKRSADTAFEEDRRYGLAKAFGVRRCLCYIATPFSPGSPERERKTAIKCFQPRVRLAAITTPE